MHFLALSICMFVCKKRKSYAKPDSALWTNGTHREFKGKGLIKLSLVGASLSMQSLHVCLRCCKKSPLLQAWLIPGVRGGLCNPSYWDGGVWGWLEDGSPPWRLLVPLWWLHLTQDQFCTTWGVREVIRAVWLSKGPLSDQIPILPSSTHGWYWITTHMWC